MPRKKQITTEEQVIPETPEPEISAEAIPAGEDAPGDKEMQDTIQNFLESNYGTAKVSIYRCDKFSSAMTFQGSVPPGFATEEYLQETFGEGKYSLRLLDNNGRYITSKVVSIGPPPVKPVSPMPGVFSSMPMQAHDNGQVEALRGELAMQREMLLKMIDKIGSNPPERSSVAELASVVQLITGIMPKPESSTGALGTMIDMFKKGLDIGARGGAPEKSWSETLKDVVAVIPDVVEVVKAQAHAQPAPSSNPASQVSNGDQAMMQLRAGINYLKIKARKGTDPNLYVDFILDNLEENHWLPIINLLSKPYESLQEIDPDLMNPVFRPWFEHLFKGLADAIRERTAASGEAGNGSGDAQDEGTSPA